MRQKMFAPIVIVFSLLLPGLCNAEKSSQRPIYWAEKVEVSGVRSLYKITDNLYRSQQPSKAGLSNLKKKLGIKTVINLRTFHSDKGKALHEGVLNEELNVKTWHIEDEDVIKVLSVLRKPKNGPFLIHCQHGSDRTGLMVAMYRIVEQGWTKDDAIAEMVNGGYGFHKMWTNIIKYIKQANVDAIRQALSKT